MLLKGDVEQGVMKIRYTVTAQFTPSGGNLGDWADKEKRIAKFRSTRLIYIFRPPIIFPIRELSFDLKSIVGGMCGMGTSEAVSTITFEKNEYYLGEKAIVKVAIDNSNCGKAVQGIKFKLHRHYSSKDRDGWQSVGSKYLCTVKAEGCQAGQKVERTVEIDIPTEDLDEGGN